jgi:maltose alpha-D-glucosyltransferase/alpha-amylase
MGDNIYLGDRNGVRTPMQWTGDRNAGFSRADTAMLYCPINVDPVYGYQGLNAEAQQRVPNSLLNWTKRLITVRRQYKTFGRGSLELINPANRAVLAFVRKYEGETLLLVHNLAGSAQPVELDLRRFIGAEVIELLGRTRFPRVAEHPYQLSLSPYGFFWFKLDMPQRVRGRS